ncbi:MAG: hypothetical protein INH37_20715, partial [Myxococcaceae bacterium]|nr:hypothetical protein [Myxococcaceae bacterium]
MMAEGEAEVVALTTRIKLSDDALPPLTPARHQHIERLMTAGESLEPLSTAVACFEDDVSPGTALGGPPRQSPPRQSPPRQSPPRQSPPRQS